MNKYYMFKTGTIDFFFFFREKAKNWGNDFLGLQSPTDLQ